MESVIPPELLKIAAVGSVSVVASLLAWLLNRKKRYPGGNKNLVIVIDGKAPVSYTHLRAHETVLDIVCRFLLEKNKNNTQ